MQKYFNNKKKRKVMNEEHEEDSQKDFFLRILWFHIEPYGGLKMPKNFTFNGDDGDDDIAITHSSFTRLKL